MWNSITLYASLLFLLLLELQNVETFKRVNTYVWIQQENLHSSLQNTEQYVDKGM